MSTSFVTLASRSRQVAHDRVEAWQSTRHGRLGLYVISLALLAAVYYLAAKLGLELAYLDGAVAAMWPPVGVGMAALFLYGIRLWPGVVVGDLLVADFSQPLGTVLAQTVGNTIAVIVAAVLLGRLTGRRARLDRVVDVFALIGCGVIAAAVSACFGPPSLWLGGVIEAGDLTRVFRTWFLSDMSGALVVTPVILTWASWGLAGFGRREALEGAAVIAALIALAEIPAQRDVPYVVFPVLIWAALRFGPRGAATALVLVSSLTVWNTAQNAGPFVRDSITHSLLASQLFIAIGALSSLVLASVTAERTRAGEALRANEERLRSIVHSMAEGLIVRDADGVITDCNAEAEEILGVARRDLIGRRPEAVVGAGSDAEGNQISSDAFLGERTLRTGESESGVVVRLERPGRAAAWVSVSSGVVRDAAGGPAGVVSTLSDITQRREAEQRLQASELAQRALADEQAALRRVATLVASEAPPSAVFERVTEEVGRLLGAPSASLLRYDDERSATVVGGWSEPDTPHLPVGSIVALDGDTVIARVYRSGEPERVESYEDAGGTLADTLRAFGYRSAVAAPVKVGGRLWGALVAATLASEPLPDGTERRLCDFADLAAQALANADAYEKLAASRARIVEAGDAERRRLERNLHDGAQQRLVTLALQLRMLEARLETDPALARNIVSAAQEQLTEALDELRELARGIHPAMLTEHGLGAALEALVARTPVPVTIGEMPEERLPDQVEAALYYVVAEAITNVAKYANASKVTVSVSRSDGRAAVEVADDGIGGADPARGSGLRGLSDRLDALNGRLYVESPPDGGTHIRAEIPC